jgi:phage baseplate assembly protein W
MSSDFQGMGWSFRDLVAPEDRGGVVPSLFEDAVRQSVWLILATAPGERVMRPDFGCRIHELLFAASSAATLGRAAQAVREALVRWEPRIELIGVDVAPDRAEPALLRVRVDYRVRTTDNRFNLVYPFYLERSAG